jgi:pimeloyl-ACP methyl ester carboxylesterase
MAMQITKIGSQTICYSEEGQGQPIILLSANPGDRRDFAAVVPALARSHRVLRLDWPGYGRSPAPEPPERAGASYFLEVFSEFVEQQRLEPFVIIGNSVGGNVAVRYALQSPTRVRGLVLVSPGGFTPHNAVTRTFCRLQGKPSINKLIGGVFTRSYLRIRNEVTRAMIARAAGEQNTDAARRVNAAVWRSFLEPQHDLREAARALRTPALVISGRHDPVIPPADGRRAAAAIPGAQFIEMKSGHAPFAEIPDEFLAVVEPFLASLTANNRAHAAR